MAPPAVCMLSASFVPTLGGTQGQCWLLSESLAGTGALAAFLAKRLRPRLRVVVKVPCSGGWSDFRLAQARPFYRRRIALLPAVDQSVVLNPESAAELEAMASALPVVATDVAGNRAVLGEDGKGGWLVPVEAPEVLAEAVATLVASPALRREIGAAGRAAVLERFAIQRVGAQYLSLYEELQG